MPRDIALFINGNLGLRIAEHVSIAEPKRLGRIFGERAQRMDSCMTAKKHWVGDHHRDRCFPIEEFRASITRYRIDPTDAG